MGRTCKTTIASVAPKLFAFADGRITGSGSKEVKDLTTITAIAAGVLTDAADAKIGGSAAAIQSGHSDDERQRSAVNLLQSLGGSVKQLLGSCPQN